MHLLLAIDSLGGGGAQRQFVNLAVGLAGRGHRVDVLTYFPHDDHLPRLLAGGVSYRNVGKRHRLDPRPLVALAETLRRERPDVVVAFLRTPSLYAELARLAAPGTPVIVSERAGVPPDGLRASDRLAGIAHLAATRVTANSEDYLAHLVRFLPALAARSRSIANGIDERFFERGRARLARASEVPRAPGGPDAPEGPEGPEVPGASKARTVRLCCVAARLSHEKGALPLVDALALLAGRGRDDVELDWIGAVDEGSALFAAVESRLAARGLAGRWHWRGRSDDVAAELERHDALVVASLHEGSANTLCEAMCAGLPVIGTDIADQRAILDDGAAGLLCRPDDAASLADAIERFLDQGAAERRAMAERAFERARERFSMGRFVDRWEALCREVVEERPVRR